MLTKYILLTGDSILSTKYTYFVDKISILLRNQQNNNKIFVDKITILLTEYILLPYFVNKIHFVEYFVNKINFVNKIPILLTKCILLNKIVVNKIGRGVFSASPKYQ